jgi:hypothetical protein
MALERKIMQSFPNVVTTRLAKAQSNRSWPRLERKARGKGPVQQELCQARLASGKR